MTKPKVDPLDMLVVEIGGKLKACRRILANPPIGSVGIGAKAEAFEACIKVARRIQRKAKKERSTR